MAMMTGVRVVIVKTVGWRVISEWGGHLAKSCPCRKQTRKYWSLEKDAPDRAPSSGGGAETRVSSFAVGIDPILQTSAKLRGGPPLGSFVTGDPFTSLRGLSRNAAVTSFPIDGGFDSGTIGRDLQREFSYVFSCTNCLAGLEPARPCGHLILSLPTARDCITAITCAQEVAVAGRFEFRKMRCGC